MSQECSASTIRVTTSGSVGRFSILDSSLRTFGSITAPTWFGATNRFECLGGKLEGEFEFRVESSYFPYAKSSSNSVKVLTR